MGAAPVVCEAAELLQDLPTRKLTEILTQRRREARKLLWEASMDEARVLMERIVSLAEIITQRRRGRRPVPLEARVNEARTLTEPILSLVEKHLHIPVAVIIGRDRRAPIIMARAIAIWLIRKELGLSYPAIGAVFKRNHTTMEHHYQRIVARTMAYPSFRQRLEGYQQELRDG